MQATKKIWALTAFLISPVLTFAAEASQQNKGDNYNITLISLVGLMLILLFVIGMLAHTLQQLSYAVRDKIRKDRAASANVIKTVALLVAMSVSCFSAYADDKTVAAPVTHYIQGMLDTDFYAVMSFIILELVVIFSLVIYINALLKIIKQSPQLEQAAKVIVKKSWFWDKFNRAASIEKEKDILLDHNYDGIQELDNSLPPWWKYGFYLTIFVGIIYIYRYHISHDGPSQQEEYMAEMQKGEEEKAAYLANSANNVDESNVTQLTDGDAILAGKDLFEKNCSPCHLADGGGNVGPNLTDDYWLHGGSIKDVFKSIKYGWQDKGMKSWKDDFSPKQIQELASFVKSLRGSHPATPKAPQGELYIEATPGKTPAADTTGTNKVAIK